MLRITLLCSNCGYEEDIKDLTNLDGLCPNCHEHHGEIVYNCNMSEAEFIQELARMNEKSITKYANAILLCAKDLSEEI